MNERGSMLPLFGGAAVLSLVIIFGVSSATSLLIERQRLFALADSAALAGAESFDPALLREGGSGIVVTLESDRVRGAVSRFLATADVSGFESLAVERAGTGDGRSADVELSSLWRPPLVSGFFPAALRISVSARSQAFIF